MSDQVVFDPSGKYTINGTLATSEAEAVAMLQDRGHPDPIGAVRAARESWLEWDAIDSPDGAKLAAGINGQWSLTTEVKLVALLQLAGFEPPTAAMLISLTKLVPVDLGTFVRQRLAA